VLYGTYIATPRVHSYGYRDSEFGILRLEDHFMYHIGRYICSLFLAAAIAAPALVVTDAEAQEANIQVRVYDRDHHDYHNWDDHENRAYRRYLAAQHRSYREYRWQHHSVQRHYWNWRHSHPDRD
jgi:hypothetical protein